MMTGFNWEQVSIIDVDNLSVFGLELDEYIKMKKEYETEAWKWIGEWEVMIIDELRLIRELKIKMIADRKKIVPQQDILARSRGTSFQKRRHWLETEKKLFEAIDSEVKNEWTLRPWEEWLQSGDIKTLDTDAKVRRFVGLYHTLMV